MNPTAQELYDQFKLIESNYGALFQACTSEAQREQLRACYNQAWSNYNIAINKTFDQNDPRVAQLSKQLSDEGQQIQNALKGLQNISSAMNTISSVVSLGTSLVLAV